MDKDVLARIKALCDPDKLKLTDEDRKAMSKQEAKLAEQVYAAIQESGLDLDYRKVRSDVHHHALLLGVKGYQLCLPFDVEVHQLPSG